MRIITYLTLLLLLMACEETPQKEPLVLWYDSPAGIGTRLFPSVTDEVEQ